LSKRSERGQRWDQSDRFESINEGKSRERERIKTLKLSRQVAVECAQIKRSGVSIGTAIQYASTSAPTDWSSADQGRAILNAILDAVEDGADRAILAWPSRPGGSFVAAAVTLREARASGRLSHATFGLWPWRNGVTWAARSILVHPKAVAHAAAKAIDEIARKAAWVDTKLSHESLCLLEMRLRDLVAVNSQQATGQSESSVVVRSPTLLETTSVFAPHEAATSQTYVSDASQVMRRVRDYTHMGDKNAHLENHLAAVGNPESTPFALFGFPLASKIDPIVRCLNYRRFKSKLLDVLVVDLTRRGRAELPGDWVSRFSILLQALGAAAGRRPPVVVLTEDAFTYRTATRALRRHNATLKPIRPMPIEMGAYIPEPGLFGPEPALPTALPAIPVEADIKDASLAVLRKDLIALGRNFRETGQVAAADGVSKALAYVRRCASLPIGLREAREVADILHNTDDDVDVAVRSLFRPKMALSPLASAADLVPQFGTEVRRLVADIERRVASWDDETPVSAKLLQVLQDPSWNSNSTLITIPDRRTCDVYLGSERALQIQCHVGDHRGLGTRLKSSCPKRLIVLGPTPDVVRALLTTPISPERVLFLGDAAGTALLTAELAPIGRLAAFSALAGRATAMAAALQRGGADEQLDLAEAEFRVSATMPEGEIDFTRSGELYQGEVIRLETRRRHRIVYRPTSDILVFSPGEIRPFERKQARDIRPGDRILVFDSSIREPIRRAIAGSRESLKNLELYHNRIISIRTSTAGAQDIDKARQVLARMRVIDPAISEQEVPNILRWLTVDKANRGADGGRQPRAARDWHRFSVFMQAVGVDSHSTNLYWRAAIVPARSYRIQEGYQFNQRVVQFILDPEGVASGPNAWKEKQRLWQLVLDAVDEVVGTQLDSIGGTQAK
jgi:hypothetical protein